jgi:hypothetical protein
MEYGYLHRVVASFSTFLSVLCGGPRKPILISAPPTFDGVDYSYLHNVVATGSTFINVARGGPYEPVCTTLHDSIEAGGQASRVPWPASWLAHFRFSAGK